MSQPPPFRRSRAGLIDTAPEAQRVLTEVHRAMPPDRKWRRVGALWREGRLLHAAGARMRHPDWTPAEIHAEWTRLHLCDAEFEPREVRNAMDLLPDESLRVIAEVAAAFLELGVPCALGGSIASSVHGVMRYTTDADLAVEPFVGREEALAARFGPDYYLSVDAMRDANRRRSMFNIIHTVSGFKVDVTIVKDRPYERSVLNRRSPRAGAPAGSPAVDLVTPEDIVLLKLEWYRLGGEVFDRQWGDVLGVLRVQAGRLDEAYLDHWAAELGVADLLAEARAEAAE